jgi:hypothetical protein
MEPRCAPERVASHIVRMNVRTSVGAGRRPLWTAFCRHIDPAILSGRRLRSAPPGCASRPRAISCRACYYLITGGRPFDGQDHPAETRASPFGRAASNVHTRAGLRCHCFGFCIFTFAESMSMSDRMTLCSGGGVDRSSAACHASARPAAAHGVSGGMRVQGSSGTLALRY